MFQKSLVLGLACLVAVASGSAAMAGRTRGSGISHDVVPAYSKMTYFDTFRAGEVAVVRVNGDHDTDLDLYVYDENGNLIASDTDGLDFCVVRFVPNWTGQFRIVVRNLGWVHNRFTIDTN